MLELAKPAVDVGLFTNDREEMLRFWQQEAGVAFSELLPLGGGVQQLRHAIGDSVLKINHCRDRLPEAPPSGIRRLNIAVPGRSAISELQDPDGNALRQVPPGQEGISQLAVDIAVSNLEAHRHFYGEVLGLPGVDIAAFACGASLLRLYEADDVARDPEQRARGYRYLTVQVYDVRSVHARVLERGGREGRAPLRLGDVAHISFVRDPDGNWIEISQRKSITGSLD